MLRCGQDEDQCVRDEWRLVCLESWWLWFPQVHCFSCFGFFSTVHFVTFHPVLKILSIGFFLQAHSFLLICLSQVFGKTLIVCFYFCVFFPMNEIWGSCVRNVSSALRWRRNSTHSEVLASKLTLQEVTLRSKRWDPLSGAFMRLNTKDSTNKCQPRASLAVYWLRLHVPGADARVFFVFVFNLFILIED